MLKNDHLSRIATSIALATTTLAACAVPDDAGDPGDPGGSSPGVTPEERREPPTPGAPGLGDSLYPTLGNGGYDVLHYDLGLRYATASPDQPIDGRVTMVARATQALSRFNLDYGGDGISAITVNGRPATWQRDGEELVITPRHPLPRGLP